MKNRDELISYNFDGLGKKGNFKKVLFPKNPGRIKDIILRSNNIVPRGNGKNLVGACIPNKSIVIDMKKFTRIKFDIKNEIVNAESGITIKELNEKLKSVGYEFPINSEEESTIGGMIAMNSSGYFGKYGKIKDWIGKIDYINGRGERLNIGRADLAEVCGMEGITGVILNADLKVIKFKEKSISILQTDEIEEIFLIAKRLKLDNEVIMLRLYSPIMSKFMGFPKKYNLIVGFNSDRGKIKNNHYSKLMNKIDNERLYLGRNGFLDSEDPKLIFEKIKDFTSYLDRLKVPYVSDLHLGIVFPYFLKEDLKKEDVNRMIQRMDGIPGEYGYGIKRKNKIDNLQKKIIHRIKLRHDPFIKMNPGKLIDTFENKTNPKEFNERKMIDKKNVGKKFIKNMNKNIIKTKVVENIPRKKNIGGAIIKDNLEIKKEPVKKDKDENIKDIMSKFGVGSDKRDNKNGS